MIFTVFLWASTWLPEWLTALLFLSVCCICQLAPVDIVLSGFTSSSAWLVVSGIIISASIVHTGPGDNMGHIISPAFQGACKRAITISVLFGLLASFVMPSAMNRIVLLIPVLDSIAKKSGYQAGDKGYKGILLGGISGTFLPATAILPANVPNNILAGLTESLYGIKLTYTGYFALHFPVPGALKTLLIILVVTLAYNDKPTRQIVAENIRMTSRQRKLGFILLLAMVLWLTEPWHHISTAWVSMLIAIMCLFPGFALLPEKPLQKINLSSFFYVSGIVSLGAVAYHSGVASYIADYLFSVLPVQPANFTVNFFTLSALAALMGLIVTMPGIPGILTPMAVSVSQMTLLPVQAIYMFQVLGFSTVFFVYQAPPLIMAVQAGNIRASEISKICFIIAVISVLLLWPLDLLWWKILHPVWAGAAMIR